MEIGHFASDNSFTAKLTEILNGIAKKNEINYFSSTAIQNLFILLAGYRSSKLICQATNALELYRMVSNQVAVKDLTTTKKIPMKQKMPLLHNDNTMETLFLSPEQIRILDSPAQHQIVWGAPGTGKTLLVMLKALQWCQEERQGNVVVLVNEHLVSKYMKFFDCCRNNGRQLKKEPIVKAFTTRADIANSESNDDIAMDERRTLAQPDVQGMIRRSSSHQIQGRTFVAVTGAGLPLSVTMCSRFITQAAELTAQYETAELRTVFRGTKNIVNCWREQFKKSSSQLPVVSIAHNVEGSQVEKTTVLTTQRIFLAIEQIINQVWPISDCCNTAGKNTAIRSLHIWQKDIAVLHCNREGVESLRLHLTKYGINCQSISESAQQPQADCVVVDFYMNAVSYEWPVVITTCESMVSMSRAIVQLYIVEQSSEALLQHVWEEWATAHVNNFHAVVMLSEITEIVRVLNEKNGLESNEDMLLQDAKAAFRLIYSRKERVKKSHWQLITAMLLKTHGKLFFLSLNQIKECVSNISAETDEWAIEYLAHYTSLEIFHSKEGKEAVYRLLKNKCIHSNIDMASITDMNVMDLIEQVVKQQTADDWLPYYYGKDLEDFIAKLRGEPSASLMSRLQYRARKECSIL